MSRLSRLWHFLVDRHATQPWVTVKVDPAFKVGDRVVVFNHPYETIRKTAVGVVTHVWPGVQGPAAYNVRVPLKRLYGGEGVIDFPFMAGEVRASFYQSDPNRSESYAAG